jgi:hypothetical protein
MAYFDTELNNAWAWFATNWDTWTSLNNEITNELQFIFENTSGPSGPHKEVYWDWVKNNRDELLELYNSLKG